MTALLMNCVDASCLDIIIVKRHPGIVQRPPDRHEDIRKNDHEAIDTRVGIPDHTLEKHTIALSEHHMRQSMKNERQADRQTEADMRPAQRPTPMMQEIEHRKQSDKRHWKGRPVHAAKKEPVGRETIHRKIQTASDAENGCRNIDEETELRFFQEDKRNGGKRDHEHSHGLERHKPQALPRQKEQSRQRLRRKGPDDKANKGKQKTQSQSGGEIFRYFLFLQVHCSGADTALHLKPHQYGENPHPSLIYCDHAILFRSQKTRKDRNREEVDAVKNDRTEDIVYGVLILQVHGDSYRGTNTFSISKYRSSIVSGT